MTVKHFLQRGLMGVAIDLRSLALMRILLALLMILKFTALIPHAEFLLSDLGVLPRSTMPAIANQPWLFSLLFLNGTPLFQTSFLAILVVFIGLFGLGLYTRVATFFCWLMLMSIQNRNPHMVDGGGDLLRLTLMWCLFLPVGHRFSLDSWRKGYHFGGGDGPSSSNQGKTSTSLYLSLGTLAISLQVFFVYFFAVLAKNSPEWWSLGNATWYALNMDYFVTDWGVWLRQWPQLSPAFTWTTLAAETFLPFLLLFPHSRPLIKGFGIIGLMMMHFSFSCFLRLGVFPWIDMAVLCLYIPSSFWSSLGILKRPFYGAHPVPPKNSTLVDSFLGILLAYALWSNLAAIPAINVYVPDKWLWLGDSTRVSQMWKMFAPHPLKDDQWLIFSGLMADGNRTNPVEFSQDTNLPPDPFKNPFVHSKQFTTIEERDFASRLSLGYNRHLIPYYAQALCRRWNSRFYDDYKLISIDIHQLSQLTLPTYQLGDITHQQLMTVTCPQTAP